MGGMWSLFRFTVETIFIAVFNNIVSIALRTLARSDVVLVVETPAGTVRLLTTVCSGRRQCHIQGPLLPANFFLALGEPCLPPLFLKKLNGDLATHARPSRSYIRARIKLSHQGSGPLIYEGFELNVFDHGQSEIQHVSGARANGWEESVEEDGMQDAFVGGD